jgi:hypothetical protein
MAKNLPHCETGFSVYRSAQLTPLLFFCTPSVQRPHFSLLLKIIMMYKIELELEQLELKANVKIDLKIKLLQEFVRIKASL